MVQMKERCLRFKKADVLKLYIPHGSDERTEGRLLILTFSHFISHMVQMKGELLI